MAQAGGGLVTTTARRPTANSARERRGAELRARRTSTPATSPTPPDVGAGWGGEAFGKQLGAMTIEGNWITGAMTADYPDVKYKVVELPAGPAGKGTLQFTNCWGMAADSPNQKAALDLVEYLTSDRPAAGVLEGVRPDAVRSSRRPTSGSSDNPDLDAVPRRSRLRAGRADHRRARGCHHRLQLAARVA